MPAPILPILLVTLGLAAAPRPGVAASAAPRADSSAAAPSPAPDTAAADSLGFRLREVGVLVPGGDRPGQVLEPSGLAIDPFGRIVVADAALHRLQRFDAAGVFLGQAGVLGSDPGQLRRPGSLAMLGTLSVAVLDRENRRVVSYDLFGRLLGVLVALDDPALLDQIGRVDPVALATDRGGALYVADADRDRLLAFDFAGRFLRVIGGVGPRPGSFRGLAGVGTTPRGEPVTAERVGARIQRLDAGGRVVAAWPLAVGPGHGGLAVAVDDSSRVAVADEVSGRLWLFDARGQRLAQLGGLDHPRALAFEPAGSLLVAEHGRVRRLALSPAGGTATEGAPRAPGER